MCSCFQICIHPWGCIRGHSWSSKIGEVWIITPRIFRVSTPWKIGTRDNEHLWERDNFEVYSRARDDDRRERIEVRLRHATSLQSELQEKDGTGRTYIRTVQSQSRRGLMQRWAMLHRAGMKGIMGCSTGVPIERHSLRWQQCLLVPNKLHSWIKSVYCSLAHNSTFLPEDRRTAMSYTPTFPTEIPRVEQGMNPAHDQRRNWLHLEQPVPNFQHDTKLWLNYSLHCH